MAVASALDNKALARRMIDEVWNKGNVAAIDELIAPEFVAHDPSLPFPVKGPAGFRQFVALYRGAYPDLKFTVEDQIGDGDKVLTRWTGRGTQNGPLGPLPPSGKSVSVSGMTLSRFVNGKAVEDWANWDAIGMMQQLGFIPKM